MDYSQGLKHRWAVFISGQGTNLQALLDAHPKVSVEMVITSRLDAPGVARAERAGVPVVLHSKGASWSELSLYLQNQKIDLIFLLGFMRVLPEEFVRDWDKKILNLHPSLLPEYRGLRAMERSYEDGAAMGVTIHWVTPQLDEGPLLLQKEIFAKGQAKAFSFEKVKTHIHQAENELVVEAVRKVQSC